MNTIDTISELLTFSGSQFRIFDIGRRIDKLSKEQFQKVELNQIAYPFPSQGHAHLAISFWQKQSPEPYLWFVKLPLDERGLLNQGARNHFIAIIIEALGSDLTVSPTEKQEELLKANPYHFTPAQYKLASLNSKLSAELKRPLSSFYPLAHQYISGKLGWDNWQQVGVQGLADIASNLTQGNNIELLSSAVSQLPSAVLQPLCLALENEILPATLITALIERHQNQTAKGENKDFILRALASSCAHPYVNDYITHLIEIEPLTEERIILLSGRCWEVFNQQKLLMTYLEKLNQLASLELFAGIFKDLVAIPSLRIQVLTCIRDPERSSEMAETIGKLFSSANVKASKEKAPQEKLH